MAHVTDWTAGLIDGGTLRRLDVGVLKSVPPGMLEGVRVETDHPAFPVVRVVLDPAKGNQAHVFTRVLNRMGFNGTPQGGATGIPVIEIIPDPDEPERFVRVLLTPDGIVVTTKDLP